MKKIFSLAVLLFSFFVSFGQIEVNWSERFYDLDENCIDAKIVAEDPNGYYMYYCTNEYKGEGEFQYVYYMARIDRNKKIEKIYRMDFGHPSFKIESTWRSGDLLGFVLSRVTEQQEQNTKRKSSRNANQVKEVTGRATLYTQFFHTKDMRLMGKPEKFKTYTYFAQEGQKPYLFNFSENKTKLAFCFFTNDTSGKAASVEIYDDRMRLLWEKTKPLTITNDAYTIKDVAVSNDGKRALVAINSFSTAKKKDHNAGKVHLMWLTEYEDRMHEESLNKGWPTDMKCAFGYEEDYLVAGYYSTTASKPDLSEGTFSLIYDNLRGYFKNSSQAQFYDYETDDDVAKGLPNRSDMVSHLDYLCPMVGGNVIMIGEQRFKSTIQAPKRRGDKPTGEDAMYYCDIILTNIDKTGYIRGNSYLPKRQKVYNGVDDFNSYALTYDRYGMYIMFNDHINNYKGNKFEPKVNYNSDKLRTQVNFIQVYNDASWRWHEAFNSKKYKMPFYKTLFLTVDKNILFLTHYREDSMLGSFETR